MKRMLDQKTIDELSALLSKVSVDISNEEISFDSNYNINMGNLFLSALYVDEIGDIRYTLDDSPIFPLQDNAGKVLAVNEDEDGLVAVEVGGGTKLYKHTITITGQNDKIIIINNVSAPFDNDTKNQMFKTQLCLSCGIQKYGSNDYLIVAGIEVVGGQYDQYTLLFYPRTHSGDLSSFTFTINNFDSDTVALL